VTARVLGFQPYGDVRLPTGQDAILYQLER